MKPSEILKALPKNTVLAKGCFFDGEHCCALGYIAKHVGALVNGKVENWVAEIYPMLFFADSTNQEEPSTIAFGHSIVSINDGYDENAGSSDAWLLSKIIWLLESEGL